MPKHESTLNEHHKVADPIKQLQLSIDSGSTEWIENSLKNLALSLAATHGAEEVENVFLATAYRVMFERHPEEWTAEMDACLGKEPDSALAKRFKLLPLRIRQRRMALGIPVKVLEHRQWADEEDALLGQMSLKDVASHLKIPMSQVRKRMDELGITTTQVAHREQWADIEYSADMAAHFLDGTLPESRSDSKAQHVRNRAMIFIRFSWSRWTATQKIQTQAAIKRNPELVRETIRRARIEIAALRAMMERTRNSQRELSQEEIALTRSVWDEPLSLPGLLRGRKI